LCRRQPLPLLQHSPTLIAQHSTSIASATSGAAAGLGRCPDEPSGHQQLNSNSSSTHYAQSTSTSNTAAASHRSHGASAASRLLLQLQDDLGDWANALLSAAAEAVSSALRPGLLRRLQALLSQPETRLLLEGCQLLACLMFVMLYIWR
jgi:hypothetical protein